MKKQMSLKEFDVGDIILTDSVSEITKMQRLLSENAPKYTHVAIIAGERQVAELNFGENVIYTPLESYITTQTAVCIRKMKDKVRKRHKHRILEEIEAAKDTKYETNPNTLAHLVLKSAPKLERTGKICTEYVMDVLAKAGLYRTAPKGILPDFFLSKQLDSTHSEVICVVDYSAKPFRQDNIMSGP